MFQAFLKVCIRIICVRAHFCVCFSENTASAAMRSRHRWPVNSIAGEVQKLGSACSADSVGSELSRVSVSISEQR